MKMILALMTIVGFSTFAFAEGNEKWVSLDPNKISCDNGLSFNLKYDGEVVFSQFFARAILIQECRAIIIQAMQDSKPVYMKLPNHKKGSPETINHLSDILVPEDGYFVRRR